MSQATVEHPESKQRNERNCNVGETSTESGPEDMMSTEVVLRHSDPSLIYSEPSNSHPLGLHVMYDQALDDKNPLREARKRVESWTSAKTGFCWIRESLPRQVPSARVLSFGYSDTPLHAAHALLAALVDDRAREPANQENDIVLLGHGFGGFVAKQLFLSTHPLSNQQQRVLNIHSLIKGIVFLGVDHNNLAISQVIRSLDFGSLRGILEWSVPANLRPELIVERYLDEWKAQIPGINSQFAAMDGLKLSIACFWETLPTTINVVTRESGILVPRDAATLNLPWIENWPLARSHLELVLYDSDKNQDCSTIINGIASVVIGIQDPDRSSSLGFRTIVGQVLRPPVRMLIGPSERHDLRILSLDGGGIKGLFSVMVLEAVMERVRQYDSPDSPDGIKPCDYFDLICGTSTGGLLAVMLGRLTYRALAEQIFRKGIWRKYGADQIYAMLGRPWFSGEVLKTEIQRVVSQRISREEKQALAASYMAPEEAMFRQFRDTKCKTLVCAVREERSGARENTEVVARLRTYDSRAGGATACKIWEACRATSAAPLFFPPITINGFKYWDGGLVSNNPIFEAYLEARAVYPTQRFRAIVSIGTGKQPPRNPSNDATTIVKYAIEQMTNTEIKHLDFTRQMVELRDVYCRLNEEGNLYKIGMDDWQQVPNVEGWARAFIASAEGQIKIDQCARKISRTQGVTTPMLDPRGLKAVRTSSNIEAFLRSESRCKGLACNLRLYELYYN
ncbi:acyl transferase/acyl hydrolase/lysophospholipase [Dactylonectria macrodidyma]|uniref:Acyl transferase/acyl hydrolase/lysophospholipase n=1 Tax=Dactylonectria macrodidyma TaxID=307937 RepID=A0A9P9EXQ3_9HYPO|nr:acyl transferase/acyl hydrolase/lysophospholipase [Dactylonectria macrodidyma]